VLLGRNELQPTGGFYPQSRHDTTQIQRVAGKQRGILITPQTNQRTPVIHYIKSAKDIPEQPRVGDEFVMRNATQKDADAARAILEASRRAFERQVVAVVFPNGTLRASIVPRVTGTKGSPVCAMTAQMRALEPGQSFIEPVGNRVMQSLRNHVSRENRKGEKRYRLRASKDGQTVTISRVTG
jgi:hypothetical protein